MWATPKLVSLRGQFQNSQRASPPFLYLSPPLPPPPVYVPESERHIYQGQIQNIQKEGAEKIWARVQPRSIPTTQEHPWGIAQYHAKDDYGQNFFKTSDEKGGLQPNRCPPPKSWLSPTCESTTPFRPHPPHLPVLDKPVVLTVWSCPIPHSQHTMIQQGTAAVRLIINSFLVELEGHVTSINRHGDGPHCSNSNLQGALIIFCNINITSVIRTNRWSIEVARLVLQGSVWQSDCKIIHCTSHISGGLRHEIVNKRVSGFLKSTKQHFFLKTSNDFQSENSWKCSKEFQGPEKLISLHRYTDLRSGMDYVSWACISWNLSMLISLLLLLTLSLWRSES